jgi:hypothetical protein
MKIHLGVADVPYVDVSEAPKKVAQAKRGKSNKPVAPPAAAGTQSTGDVAEILEGKYGIMGAFAEKHEDDIAKALENSLAGTLENLMMGAPPANNPFGTAEMAIEDSFKAALDSREFDGITGVPTQAALKGINHRLKSGKGSPRPSFIDTGLYQASFKAWVE